MLFIYPVIFGNPIAQQVATAAASAIPFQLHPVSLEAGTGLPLPTPVPAGGLAQVGTDGNSVGAAAAPAPAPVPLFFAGFLLPLRVLTNPSEEEGRPNLNLVPHPEPDEQRPVLCRVPHQF